MARWSLCAAPCFHRAHRPELAQTRLDYTGCLPERSGEDGRAKATSLLDGSLAISRELGIRPPGILMERALSRREILKA